MIYEFLGLLFLAIFVPVTGYVVLGQTLRLFRL